MLSLFIYAGSVALGWHYATDGLVGAMGAALCFYAARLYLGPRRAISQSYSEPVPAE
jgi:membrane-associated phospholipid phosphatase